jgi:glycogen debranching enzyme
MTRRKARKLIKIIRYRMFNNVSVPKAKKKHYYMYLLHHFDISKPMKGYSIRNNNFFRKGNFHPNSHLICNYQMDCIVRWIKRKEKKIFLNKISFLKTGLILFLLIKQYFLILNPY